MLARVALALHIISAASGEDESYCSGGWKPELYQVSQEIPSSDGNSDCRQKESDQQRDDHCNFMQKDVLRSLQTKHDDVLRSLQAKRDEVSNRQDRPEKVDQDLKPHSWFSVFFGNSEDGDANRRSTGQTGKVAEPPPQAAQLDNSVAVSPGLSVAGARQASEVFDRKDLSAVQLVQTDTQRMQDAEEESALSAQVQLTTALKRVENGLHAAKAEQMREHWSEHALEETLVESAAQVRASQQSADNQIVYSSRMSEFLEDAAKQAEDARGMQGNLVAKEEKASQFLEKALEEVLAASTAGESQNNMALQKALEQALKAQAEVVAGAAQQEQATSNLNTALHSAAKAAMASEEISKLQLSPSLGNISKKIDSMQSTARNRAMAETKAAKYVDGVAQNAVLAGMAADRMSHSWQEVKDLQHREVQHMDEVQRAVAKESMQSLEEGRHAAQLLQQAQKDIEENKKQTAEQLRLVAAEKARAMNMVQDARQKVAWTEKQMEENTRILSEVKQEVARTVGRGLGDDRDRSHDDRDHSHDDRDRSQDDRYRSHDDRYRGYGDLGRIYDDRVRGYYDRDRSYDDRHGGRGDDRDRGYDRYRGYDRSYDDGILGSKGGTSWRN